MKSLYLLPLFFLFSAFAGNFQAGYEKTVENLIKTKGLKKTHLGLTVLLLPSQPLPALASSSPDVIAPFIPINIIATQKTAALKAKLSLKTQKPIPLYSLNEKRLFIPASLVKIASLSAFYHYFPSNFRFQTQLFGLGSVSGEQLNGSLVIKGGGDSSFTSESLWNVVNVFKRTGITHIKGDILVDDSLYKPFKIPHSSSRSYHALPSASSFNWNSVTFWVRWDKTQVHILTDPENSYIKTLNRIRPGKTTRLKIQEMAGQSKGEVFQIQGTFRPSDSEKVFYRKIQNPPLWLGNNLMHFLKQRGITVRGRVKKGNCSSPFQYTQNTSPRYARVTAKKGDSSRCKKLADWESRPLQWHTHNMMKFSNNFVSLMLTTHLPLLKGSKKGDLQKGLQLIRTYLTTNSGLKNFHLAEPSGLSRKNRFSPEHLKTLLIKDSKSFFAPEILASYPLAQGMGTLKNSFKELPQGAFVRAKTGSISGVQSLAGWAQNRRRQKFAFVFIYNGPHTTKAKELFEEP